MSRGAVCLHEFKLKLQDHVKHLMSHDRQDRTDYHDTADLYDPKLVDDKEDYTHTPSILYTVSGLHLTWPQTRPADLSLVLSPPPFAASAYARHLTSGSKTN
ncbi:hypothetical protein D9C73_019305 [Collichthys lucidus]|uniref:Uncharacterized protein n=1 Tax=Collichthys lucidus TaxID=240159 RepID=A0A4U5VD46_COLLU|nr:hypothetical protein D9C73_019305 [Collichthys lucidus]